MAMEGIEMGISLMSIPLLLVFALPASLYSQTGMPLMRSVDPNYGRTGDVLTVQGDNLGRDDVMALYLTNDSADVKVPIVEQTSASIKFSIPREAKPGRFALMVLTGKGGGGQKLIEQPVKVTVEPASPGPT